MRNSIKTRRSPTAVPSTRAAAGGQSALQRLAAAAPRVAALQRWQGAAMAASTNSGAAALQRFADDAAVQRQMEDEELMQGRFESAVQRKAEGGASGLPAPLASGIEALSGTDVSDVRVHYGSAAPAAVDALAHTQGSDIHVGPGQEQHLAHEAWHAVQQKQGRVQPTTNVGGQPVNDDPALETEADRMGAQALEEGLDGRQRG